MMTFDEWLVRRRIQSEGLWMSDDNSTIGLSPTNPLPKNSASNKSLKKKPKPLTAAVPTFKPYKPAQPARFVPAKPAQPAKIVMQKRGVSR